METTKQVTLNPMSQRFMETIAALGLTGYAVAKQIPQISEASLTHIRSGRNLPSKKAIDAFCNKFKQVDKHWLITGEGTMFIPIVKSKEDPAKNIYSVDTPLMIPIYDELPKIGGYNGIAGSNNVKPIGHLFLTDTDIRFVFRVRGFSFEPIIRSGNYIAVKPVTRGSIIDPEKIYYIVTEHDRMIKRLAEDVNSDFFRCKSSSFAEIRINKKDISELYQIFYTINLV